MEPLLIMAPGAIGGLVLAFLIARLRYKVPSTFVPRRLDAPNPALINMAQIKVEGVGGLGLVLAVLAVALSNPGIREALIVSFLLGAGLAICLVAVHRRLGAAHEHDGPDDRSTLHLVADGRRARAERTDAAGHTGRLAATSLGGARRVAALPGCS